ncbi:hypothetical protein BDQ17DRAFT_1344125 [Cyathus striatus]|nr:hypothetical protein BDQ17DRAFT_1344125 [Cyathus striatus]
MATAPTTHATYDSQVFSLCYCPCNYHHLNCDLHEKSDTNPESELSKAQFQRGIEWEETLSFFIAGLNLWPPMDELHTMFLDAGSEPVKFGLAKPDLVEITRTEDCITWKVIDAKASKRVKTSHHIQIYFYTMCLSYILPRPLFQNAGDAGYHKAIPNTEDIRSIDISLLAPAIDQFIFYRLPRILYAPRQNVSWHYNPLCRGCDYEAECRANAEHERTFGSMPNISIGDAQTLNELLRHSRHQRLLSEAAEEPLSDIEDLHLFLSNPTNIHQLDISFPSVARNARRILYLPPKRGQEDTIASPVVDSVRTNTVQIIPRRNYTCPAEEDIAVILSLMIDPSSPDTGIERFCASIYSNTELNLPSIIYGSKEDLISCLANIIRELSLLSPPPRTQFYVWSAGEQTALQLHMVQSALTSTNDLHDTRLCIGALAQGASLLQTTMQPLLLSGALLSFLSKKLRKKAEYEACLERIGLSTHGTVNDMRKRLEKKLQEFQTPESVSASNGERQRELGQLHCVVVLKRELERLIALPVPGYWDLPECASVLLTTKEHSSQYPKDEDIFRLHRKQNNFKQLKVALSERNSGIYAILRNFRDRVSGHRLLVNNARILSTRFLDICEEEHLRKLFFMQQFEVLTKLSELWESRIAGCTDAPVLEYCGLAQGSDHFFRLVSGSIDVAPERERPMYDKLLALDTAVTQGSQEDIPVEALFDDLAVSGLVFPLNRYTRIHWDKQHSRVKDKLLAADVGNVVITGSDTIVTVKVWGSWKTELEPGRCYRLSSRLVDFNTTKVLSSLFELDLQFSSNDGPLNEGNSHRWVPFLQLILDPKSLGNINRSQEYLKVESTIQRLFRQLSDLGSTPAASLLLKPSQHKATQRILSNRLSVIWGPPGTGKTHTVALSLMRLLEVEHKLRINDTKIVFITAMTHAAIAACQSKLERLIECYKQIEALPAVWLDRVRIEEVRQGNDHPAPSSNASHIHIYTGTIYQLYNFTRKRSLEADCVVVDEAGQIPFASLALVLRSLSTSARIIVAGDSEQLAPILSAQYPQLKTRQLFGSILDSIMPASHRYPVHAAAEDASSQESQETVVQLTENFRLNPDLGEFISTIYSRQFKPQKVQARQLANSLEKVKGVCDLNIKVHPEVLDSVQVFFISLSEVMLRKQQSRLAPPLLKCDPQVPELRLTHHPVSLSLIRLQTRSFTSEHFGPEKTVYAEAELAVALVISLRKCCPEDNIFVATPHRAQREAVKSALSRVLPMVNRFDRVQEDTNGEITVDTIERLQGSEAAFVICLFTASKSLTSDLRFLLERRRLNVAISRAKTLCILVTSPEVLCPSIWALSNEETAKGYAFLKAYEKRAWSYDLNINVDDLLRTW